MTSPQEDDAAAAKARAFDLAALLVLRERAMARDLLLVDLVPGGA